MFKEFNAKYLNQKSNVDDFKIFQLLYHIIAITIPTAICYLKQSKFFTFSG